MLDKIKTKLIHWLGGYTYAELRKDGRKSYELGVDIGEMHMAYRIKDFADSLYGLPADDWCKQMYEHIKQCPQNI